MHATSRHRAESAIPGCYRRPRRLSAPKSSPTAAPAHGQPGPPLFPAAPFPCPPGALGTPPSWGFPLARPGFVPLALSRPGMGPYGGMYDLLAGRLGLAWAKCHHVLAGLSVIQENYLFKFPGTVVSAKKVGDCGRCIFAASPGWRWLTRAYAQLSCGGLVILS